MEANYFGNTRHIQYGSYQQAANHFWSLFISRQQQQKNFNSFSVAGNDVRVVGRLIGQTGRFRVVRISNIDIDNEEALIERLKAITAFELTKLKWTLLKKMF